MEESNPSESDLTRSLEMRQIVESVLEGRNWGKSVLELSYFGEDAIKALISFLSEKDDRGWRVILAISRIGEGRESAIKLLLEALKNPELRKNAERCLSLMVDPRIKRPKVVDVLIEALEDENEIVRIKAAELLGEIGDRKAIKPLIDALRDKAVREKAAWALTFMGKRCVKDVLKILKSDPEMRGVAKNILVRIGVDAVDGLISVLDSELWFVRKNAVEALGEIGDRKALPHLIRLMEDEDVEVRRAARRAIESLGKSKNDSSSYHHHQCC